MIDLSRDSRVSKVLELLRFPLAALIVFKHTPYSDDKYEFSFYLGKIISEGIGGIAVPTFFFISGYLFFAKYESFGVRQYISALRKKFISLAVPYILWIAIVFYTMGFLYGFKSDPWDFYHIFWAKSDGFVAKTIFGYTFSAFSTPSAVSVLWFVRDLMVVILFTPVFWFITRRLGLWSIALYLIPNFMFIGIPIQGFGIEAFCFFPIGAAFSICGKDIVKIASGWGMWVVYIFLVLLLVKVGTYTYNIQINRIVVNLMIISGVISTFIVADKLSYNMKLSTIFKFSEYLVKRHSFCMLVICSPFSTFCLNICK